MPAAIRGPAGSRPDVTRPTDAGPPVNPDSCRLAAARIGAGHVLVVGDVMLDRYWFGPVPRVSPEAPVVVVSVRDQQARVGGAGNVAANVAALGTAATVIGLIGDDAEGRQVEQLLAERGVEPVLTRRAGARTTAKLRVISRQQQLIRLDFEDGSLDQGGEALSGSFAARLAGCGVVVLSDYAKGALSAAQSLISGARAAGRPVVVDPKGLDFSKYRGATLITPNLAEFQAVVGPCSDEATIEAKARRLAADLALDAVLVTRSERGLSLVPAEGPALHLAAEAREIYDVTGAGDTVVATVAACLAAGVDLRHAVALANLAAGVVVGKFGTATVSRPELEAALLPRRTDLSLGALTEPELLAEVAAARGRGERIVMTNGCFDLLHPGHLAYLKEARALGDRLIVAVNDDASVRSLKGEGRPVNPLATREAMLAALGCVDWVVAFSGPTPERLIAAVRPDVLVKGGDYRADEIAGADSVRAAGGEVRILSFVDGHSTTGYLERLRAPRP